MNEEQVLKQVESLRTALEQAKAKLLEQKQMLDQLTSPPFAYATVVAVSEWAKEEPLPEPLDRIRIDRNVRSRHGYDVGDQLILVTNESLSSRVMSASQHIVVGFSGDDVVTDHDGTVVSDPYKSIRRWYKIEKKAEKVTAATAVITVEGKFLEVLLPKGCNVKPGDTVTVVMETMQIVDVASVQVGGNVAYLRRVIDGTFSEVDYESAVRIVFNGKAAGSLEKGDRVVLDATATVIIRNLGKEDERFSFTAETNVTWDEIGGLAEAKKQMIEAVELPHTNPKIFEFYGKRPVKGILLYGPPGCGKTMLGKATATALARIYRGDGASAGFIYIKDPEILDRFVGVAEATIRQIFARARKHKETHGYPAVVFIDEADAILAKRGSGISSDIERTIVPMFLTEMDGLEDSGALVILATNRSDILDPAVVRDGRIDRKIKIDRPTTESAAEIFLLNLKRVPLNNGYAREELAKLGSDEVFASRRVLYQIRTNSNGVRAFTLGDIVNGGMIVNVVDQATSIALHRDLGKKKPEGLCKSDLVAAVDAVERQNRDLNHTDELAEFVHDFREDVVSIQRLRQAAA
ncbi:MAG: AAA family ATPase [Candidatus Kerfeldbacteria bacterium]|nr:AAA family ATPase [Candidatus Kerfeldbacteria bacterium]